MYLYGNTFKKLPKPTRSKWSLSLVILFLTSAKFFRVSQSQVGLHFHSSGISRLLFLAEVDPLLVDGDPPE